MCIEPPRPCDTPSSRPNSSAMTLLGSAPRDERVAVRAVGGDQVVLVAHRADGADDRRLLADREVQEAADLRLRVHLARALLEAADEHHRLEPLARGVALGQLALRGPLPLLLRHVGHGLRTLARDPVSPTRRPHPPPGGSLPPACGRLNPRRASPVRSKCSRASSRSRSRSEETPRRRKRLRSIDHRRATADQRDAGALLVLARRR